MSHDNEQPYDRGSALTTDSQESTSTASSSSSTGSLGYSPTHADFSPQSTRIRFAPLPILSPRRKPSRPMGVAGRSALVRKRRTPRTFHDHELQDYRHQTEYWEDDGNGGRRLVAVETEKGATYRAEDPAEELLDDPFLLLGRLVKGASRDLWKRVSKGNKGRRKRDAVADEGKSPDDVEDVREAETVKEELVIETEVESQTEDTENGLSSPAERGGSQAQEAPADDVCATQTLEPDNMDSYTVIAI